MLNTLFVIYPRGKKLGFLAFRTEQEAKAYIKAHSGASYVLERYVPAKIQPIGGSHGK